MRPITGQRIAAVVGADPHQGPWDVADELTNDGQRYEPTSSQKRGIAFKAVIGDLLWQSGVHHTSTAWKNHDKYEGLASSVDGMFETFEGPGIVNFHSPGLYNFKEMRAYGVPSNHVLRCQWDMALRDVSHGLFVIFNAEEFQLKTFPLSKDLQTGEWLIRAARAFLLDLKDGKRPTKPVEKRPEIPDMPGEVIMRDDPEFAEAANAYFEAKNYKSTAEGWRKKARERLSNVIGNGGVYENGQYKVQKTVKSGNRHIDFDRLSAMKFWDPLRAASIMLAHGVDLEVIGSIAAEPTILADYKPFITYDKGSTEVRIYER